MEEELRYYKVNSVFLFLLSDIKELEMIIISIEMCMIEIMQVFLKELLSSLQTIP